MKKTLTDEALALIGLAEAKRRKPVTDQDAVTYKVGGDCICDATQQGTAHNGVVCTAHKDKAALKAYQRGYVDGLRKASEKMSEAAQRANRPDYWGLVSEIIAEAKAYAERVKLL